MYTCSHVKFKCIVEASFSINSKKAIILCYKKYNFEHVKFKCTAEASFSINSKKAITLCYRKYELKHQLCNKANVPWQ